ncbi:MAG: DUF4838 domain-containing protein [Pirellulales bacterium]|nr:DUF4838 domain-containing protein [Pirellulales bacterium]
MRRFAAVLAILGLLTVRGFGEEFVLIENGRSDCVIVLPAEPSPVETTAAGELQKHLQEVTGAKLEIVNEGKVPAGARRILVGASAEARKLLGGLDLQSLGHDGIVMKTAGNAIVLAGRAPRGTLYAVYTFLEDVVGCRWWTATESFAPKRPTLKAPALDTVYAPPLRYRESFYRGAFEGVFSARIKCNGAHNNVAPEYGGHHRFAGFVHTFYPLLPPEKYFAEHPDWYSEIDGKRTHEHAQLCLTNEAMRQELVRNALELLRKTPEAGLVSVSQNDWHGRCQCAACRTVEEEEGAASGPLLRFVNAVAEPIEKEFPDVLVETLAYQYTRQPPKKVKPRHNVIIRLCSIECSFSQPLSEGPQNEPFRKDIEAWCEVAPQLFVWDYVTNFSNYILPHPNLRVLGPNVRYFVDHKVVGLFEQGDYGSNVGDFVRMRAWVLAHLMWNPKQDERKLIREFLEGYYGAAAPHLLGYLDGLQDAAQRKDVYLRCFMQDTGEWLDLEDLNQATRRYRQAEAAVAGDATLSARVRRERLALDHAWLQRYFALKRKAVADKTEFLGPADPAAACEDFIRVAEANDAGQYREGQAFSDLAERLRRRFRPAGPPPDACKDLPTDAWIDVQDNEFNLARPGHWADTVADPAASDKFAVRMPGDHYEWATSWPYSGDLGDETTWRCHVVARCEASATAGPAMTMGIYDYAAKRNVASRQVSVEESAGEAYRVFDLGSHKMTKEMSFWVAPPRRPEEVKAVFVDRIFLIRE